MTCHCHHVMVTWDGTEMVIRCPPQVLGWESVNLSGWFTHHPPNFGYSFQEGKGGFITNVE